MLFSFKHFLDRFTYKFMNNSNIVIIQDSLLMLLPIILIGSFATLLKSLPLHPYSEFLSTFANGIIVHMLNYVYFSTLGVFSIYITICIAYNYCQTKMSYNGYWFGPIISALASFMIMSNFSDGNILAFTGINGIFTAMICSLLSCKLFVWLSNKISTRINLYADGTNIVFNQSIQTFLPILFIIFIFGFIKLVLFFFDINSLQELFVLIMNSLFSYIGTGFFSGFLYIVLSTIMWFFGIHGSNVMYDVANSQFASAASIEQSTILTLKFFPTFIYFGGCGATLCLLIAILLFSKRKGNRSLSKVSLLPSIFNISELTVFGLPLVLNPILFIPFLLTPIVIYLITYSAMTIGLVPYPVMDVEWTTPIFISGLVTTDSIRGALLQLFSLCVGVSIYAPFIKQLDKEKERSGQIHLNALVNLFKETTDSNQDITLINLKGTNGEIAKSLVLDLKNAVASKSIDLYYQPLFNKDKNCVGAETLLRWNHPVYGMIFPPLVIKLAKEASLLYKLEEYVFTKAIEEFNNIDINHNPNSKLKLSINVSVPTILDNRFLLLLEDLSSKIDDEKFTVSIELTEQTELKITSSVESIFTSIKGLGFLIALDDFSMGHTSLKYLQSGHFDIVKLDGELIKNLLTNPRSKDIIVSIVHLSSSLNFDTVAEYVETDEQLETLNEIGCKCYQGYLYSPAIPYKQFIEFLKDNLL